MSATFSQPGPLDRMLFAIWDAVERARDRQGESTALLLARQALEVITGEQAAPTEHEGEQS